MPELHSESNSSFLAVQGIGAGGMIATSQIIVADLVPLHERGTLNGLLSLYVQLPIKSIILSDLYDKCIYFWGHHLAGYRRSISAKWPMEMVFLYVNSQSFSLIGF